MQGERSVRRWRRATGVAGLVAVTVGGLLAGCSSPVGTASAPSAAIATTADCRAPQVLAALGLAVAPSAGAGTTTAAPAHPDAPAAGAVPDGFTPVAVLECSSGGALRDSQGTWTSVKETRREGDLAPLLAMLARASKESPTPSPEVCAPRPGAIQLWLVDVLEQAVRVAMPTTQCGVPSADVVAAVDVLTVTDVTTYPVQLVSRS